MQIIWSPWRMDYMMNQEKKPKSECLFCSVLKQEDGLENLIVHRAKLSYVILNRYPYTSGHLMVVPYIHQPSFELLDTATRSEIMELMSRAVEVLGQLYQPDGFNVGANIGSAAGAGVAGHVHFHVLPRWAGDTNFLTAVAETRVLPEDLNETFRRVCQAW